MLVSWPRAASNIKEEVTPPPRHLSPASVGFYSFHYYFTFVNFIIESLSTIAIIELHYIFVVYCLLLMGSM